LILSHAHIDHCVNIPNLVKRGFHGPIHTTYATRDLTTHMLRDSGRIQESDAAFLNKRAARRGRPADAQPLYTEADAVAALNSFTDHLYLQPFEVAPGVIATFYDAGHILGSAMVALDISEKGRRYRLAFSGDIGRHNLPILNDPTFLSDVDYVIMESTYGTRNHPPPEQAFADFARVVKETIARGGKLIIPAFAVGRAQDLIYDLHRLIHSGEIPPIPVYVDSPLAVDISAVFRAHPEVFDEETKAFVGDGEAFIFDSLKYTRSVEESKAINDQKGPLIIISASGMCESGRILHHLRNNIENPNNTILIVSWQAANTLGRRIAERAPEVRIFGDTFKLKAKVVIIHGYSGHAGRDLLIQWASALKPRVKKIFLVHGEPESLTALTQALKNQGVEEVYAPQLHETVEV
jgi:metallo-beta-lactamase family protein